MAAAAPPRQRKRVALTSTVPLVVNVEQKPRDVSVILKEIEGAGRMETSAKYNLTLLRIEGEGLAQQETDSAKRAEAVKAVNKAFQLAMRTNADLISRQLEEYEKKLRPDSRENIAKDKEELAEVEKRLAEIRRIRQKWFRKVKFPKGLRAPMEPTRFGKKKSPPIRFRVPEVDPFLSPSPGTKAKARSPRVIPAAKKRSAPRMRTACPPGKELFEGRCLVPCKVGTTRTVVTGKNNIRVAKCMSSSPSKKRPAAPARKRSEARPKTSCPPDKELFEGRCLVPCKSGQARKVVIGKNKVPIAKCATVGKKVSPPRLPPSPPRSSPSRSPSPHRKSPSPPRRSPPRAPTVEGLARDVYGLQDDMDTVIRIVGALADEVTKIKKKI